MENRRLTGNYCDGLTQRERERLLTFDHVGKGRVLRGVASTDRPGKIEGADEHTGHGVLIPKALNRTLAIIHNQKARTRQWIYQLERSHMKGRIATTWSRRHVHAEYDLLAHG